MGLREAGTRLSEYAQLENTKMWVKRQKIYDKYGWGLTHTCLPFQAGNLVLLTQPGYKPTHANVDPNDQTLIHLVGDNRMGDFSMDGLRINLKGLVPSRRDKLTLFDQNRNSQGQISYLNPSVINEKKGQLLFVTISPSLANEEGVMASLDPYVCFINGIISKLKLPYDSIDLGDRMGIDFLKAILPGMVMTPRDICRLYSGKSKQHSLLIDERRE